MNINIQLFSATIIIICIFASVSEATKDGVQHCNDKMRGLIENSCKTIMSAHKQRQEMYQAYPSIVKRENNFEPDYYVEYLDGESFEDMPKGHRLYEVRQKSYPQGAHLIVNQFSAKMLRASDSDYIVKPRPIVYRSNNKGVLIKDTTFRQKRDNNKRDISHKIAGCCENDIGCILALCVVRH